MSTDEERTAWVDGLRQLADFVEANPELPLPHAGAAIYLWGENPKADLANAVRIMGNVEKKADDFFIGADRKFGPITLSVKAARETVCERVVVGTRTRTHDVPPAGVVMEKREVTEEIVKWICPPSILALGSADSEPVAS